MQWITNMQDPSNYLFFFFTFYAHISVCVKSTLHRHTQSPWEMEVLVQDFRTIHYVYILRQIK